MSSSGDVIVIPNHGPFAGREVPYERHAAEAAVANGFAEYPAEEEATDVLIPEDFPAAAELIAADILKLSDVPKTLPELTDLPGIGKKKAEQILAELGG
jgi:predicted flap endonuclease-1-like 5' DNA nuclease